MLRIALCLSCFLYATAWADLTIQGTHSPGIHGGIDRVVIYLADDQMRIDRLTTVLQGGEPGDGVVSSVLIRFSGRPSGLLYLDHGSKRIRMLSSLREIGADQTARAGAVRVVKQGQTREILGHTAYRYDFSFSEYVDPLLLLGQQLPAEMAGQVRVKLLVTGTSWVVPDMEGASELADFFVQLNKRQLTIGHLAQNQSETAQELSILSPGLSSALTDVFAQITRAGFPLLTQTHSNMKTDMQGGFGKLFQGMLESTGIASPQSTESMVSFVDTADVPPDIFYGGLLPPGYSLNTPQ
ncbi:MAG: hypothetical protein WBS20_00835 [Lysobacterales bacterium]